MAAVMSQPAVRTGPHPNLERSRELALAAAREAEDNRGQDVIVLDLRSTTPAFDYFVIATGTSNRQLRAMSDAIDDVLQKQHGHRRYGIEGYAESDWIVLDYGSVVVHLFAADKRDYYRLEELWAGAVRVPR